MLLEKIKNPLKYYFSNLLFVWLAILVYTSTPYYANFLNPTTQQILFSLAVIYTLAFPTYLFLKLPSKGYLAVMALKKLAIKFVRVHDEKSNLEKSEKTALLFILVKFFFLPIMVNFLLDNYSALTAYPLRNIVASQDYFLNSFYPFALTFLFFIDTLWFVFGYTVEAGFLKSKVRSVEPTFFGWFVALMCYPPFNSVLNSYIGWYSNDYIELSRPSLTAILRISILASIGIYTWATLALGAKCSNLTNRGIVSKGPYAIIRHPAYVFKNLAWWLTIIPVMNIYAFISLSVWTIIYYFRAVTEEKHLIADPDYQDYCRKVRCKFIPYVW
ncbi:hypothetical protein HYU14_06365 [Candidatus Woesearchaeota archaeon]|nr:hypothetical protein [Candidatus Woesearchaeota archaeon]